VSKEQPMKATRDAYGEVLVELGREHSNIVVLDADLSGSTKTAKFRDEFPERFFNAGIAEQNMTGMAAGLATTGKIPFVSTFAIFATGRAFEQVRNTICYPGLNVKICATHSGLTVGEDGASHQALEDIALMRVIPNLRVAVPADANEAKAIIRAAVEVDGPVYVRLGRPKVPVIFEEGREFTFGKAHIVKQGTDVTIVACGIMLSKALEAAVVLAGEGIMAEVINASSIKPFDADTVVESARKTGAVVTAEEHSIIGGLGSAVAESLVEQHPVSLRRVGVRDCFGSSGSPQRLLTEYGLEANDIVAAVKEVVKA